MYRSANVLRRTFVPLKYYVRHNPFPIQYTQFLRRLPVTQTSVLNNGVVVATEERDCPHMCIGLYFNAGSRYESNFENGIAHFFEHLAYKATSARARTVLETQMSSTGAKFGCFTGREIAAYYAQCLPANIQLVFDILSDCLFNNSLSPQDIEREKTTVYEEMLQHELQPEKYVYDYLHQTAFQGSPLAQTIMGQSGNLYNFTGDVIRRYLNRYFTPSRTVVVAVGNVKHDYIVKLASTYLDNMPPSLCNECNVYRFSGSEVRYRDDSQPVANAIIAFEAPNYCDDDRLPMDVARMYLGGWDRSQYSGENHAVSLAKAASSGICDSYKGIYIKYSDTGLWGVHFTGNSLVLEAMLMNIQDEFMHMCTTITDNELQRAKRELKTKVVLHHMSLLKSCSDIGASMLYTGYNTPLWERLCLIDGVKTEKVKEVVEKYVYDRCPAVAAVGQTEGLPDYMRIRASMYWLRI